MSDKRTRDLEQKARAEGTPDSVANFLKARVREGAADLELLRILGTFIPDLRHSVLKLIVDLPEDRQVLLEVMAMMEDQIGDALQFAIQPREGDASLPSREVILQSIHRTLTSEQSRAFLDKKEIHEPKLVLVPVTSFERYTEILREVSQIMEGFSAPNFSGFLQNQLTSQAIQAEVEDNKIKKWKFVITEGAQTFDIPEWDNGQETFQERIGRFNGHYAINKLSRLDCQSYIALMTQALRQGKPIDCKYLNHSKKTGAQFNWQFTLLNETDEGQGIVGIAHWFHSNRGVHLDFNYLFYQIRTARFRLGVVGNVEI